jgi:hypothetical protein
MSNWRIAISLTFPGQAHMVQGYLESEGIDTMLEDELTTQVNIMYSNAIGGVKVLVRDEDYENSQLILQKGGYLNPEEEPKIEIVYYDKTTNKKLCPFCRSENIGKRKEPDVITMIVSLILGMIVPIFRRSDNCFDCGKVWKYLRQKD